MKIFRIVWSALLALTTLSASAIEVGRLTCELQVAPLALDTATPRFGWQLLGSEQSQHQTAYAIELTTADGTPIWSSGKVSDPKSQFRPYTGPTLQPLTSYRWRVQVWDEGDRPSAWSEPASFRLAPDTAWLDAEWIGAISYADARLPEGRKFHGAHMRDKEVLAAWDAVDSLAWRSICLRKEFSSEKEIAEATVYLCGLGHYELSINGQKVGESVFAPLWSDYHKTVYYNTYDVTELLHRGKNALGVLLGNGFYNIVDRTRYRKLQIGFGPETLNLKLLVRYTDGTEQLVRSDASWRYTLSPISFNTIYGGEDYDARLEEQGWNEPNFDESSWRAVVVQEAPKGTLRPEQAPPVKIMHRYTAQSVHKLTPEEVERASTQTKRTVDESAILLDMGQNMAGFPEIVVRGRAGQKITILTAEAKTDSNATQQRQTGRQHYYTYTLKGEGRESWHPHFSYYGFRYMQIEGAVLKGMKNPKKLPVIEVANACFVHNSAEEIASFESSNKIFNAAHELIHKAVRSNMQSVWTDCPHREKLGWLEQVHLNGPGLFYNYNLTTYLPKVMRDIADAQRPDGMIPTTAPNFVIFEGPGMDAFHDSPEWSATVVMAPFMYYEAYGDDRLIRDYYPVMRRWVEYLGTRAEGHLIDFGLGDWYDYGDFRAGFSRNTPVGLVASAHYILALEYLTKAAKLVGNAYDEAHYAALKREVVEAFNQKYLNLETKQYGTGSQCSNALPLFLDIVPAEHRAAVLENLVADIHAHGTRLTTGDVGNRYLFQTLARNDLNEVMYAMHNHEEVPGYGFQLKYGATTLTEQWDPRQGSSWNHFMMGQIDEWFFRSLAGLQPDPNGGSYATPTIAPEPVGDLAEVETSYRSLWGEYRVAWSNREGLFTLRLTVPTNCRARVVMPYSGEVYELCGGTHTLTEKH